MEEALAGFPLLFGLLASMIHVVAGPDHLAAVSPLALNANKRPYFIGMAWGIGHVAGMLLIGMIFFFFREIFPIEFISENSEKIVGILLIVIGIWALYKAFTFSRKSHKHAHTHINDNGGSYIHDHEHSHSKEHSHKHPHEYNSERQSYWAAAGIGVLHGFAGVSHIVSMLPTLAFETNFEAIVYLIGFATGTIAAMVIFSYILGIMGKTASKQKKNTMFIIINSLAGIAAIVVGIFWMWNTF